MGRQCGTGLEVWKNERHMGLDTPRLLALSRAIA
jgi:hypothetical protein